MSKTLTTLFVAVFALLLAGPAMAAPADQPATDTQPAAVEAAPAAASSAIDAPLFQLPITPEQAEFEECGDIFCPPTFFCCNPLENLCVREGQACIL